MKFIRKTKVTITKSGNKIRWGEFLCSFCLQEVERQISSGLKAQSCGCERDNLVSKKLKGKSSKNKGGIKSIEIRIKMSEAAKKRYINKENHPMYGKKRSEETKQKIREANIGKILIKEQRQKMSKTRIERGLSKGENNPMYGKKHIEKSRQQISETMIQNGTTKGKNNPNYNVHRFGELSPNWNNGSSFEPYAPEFNKELKTFILKRDNYTCQCPNCEHKTDLLDIHHIDYDKKNNTSENLVTLCDFCHTRTNGKNKRLFWTEFYQNIMINRVVECLL